MKYRLREVDFNANGNFSSTPAEEWIIGNKKIISVHGTLKVSDTKIVEHNGLVGIQLSVKGKLDLSNFPNGRVLAIGTIAFFETTS